MNIFIGPRVHLTHSFIEPGGVLGTRDTVLNKTSK